MKGYLSVLKLYARGTIYQIVVRMLVLIGVECALFVRVLNKYADGLSIGATKLTALIDQSQLHYAFLLGLIFCVMTPLSEMGVSKTTRVEYTLQRLSITRRDAVLVQWGYNTACYLLFWMIQTMVMIGMCLWSIRLMPAHSVNQQTLVLAFYQQSFLHNLLPLSDWYRWVRNIALFAAFGLMTARFTDLQRRGKNAVGGTTFLIWMIAMAFWSETSWSYALEIIRSGVCVVIIFFSLVNMQVGDDEDEEDEHSQPDI